MVSILPHPGPLPQAGAPARSVPAGIGGTAAQSGEKGENVPLRCRIGEVSANKKGGADVSGRRLCRVARNYWIASFFAELTAFFGNVSSSTPSAYFAWAVASSTSWARVKLRATLP